MSAASEPQQRPAAGTPKTKNGFKRQEVVTAIGTVMVVQDQLTGMTLGYHGSKHCRRLHSITCASSTSLEELERHFGQVLQAVQDEEAQYLASFKVAQKPLRKERAPSPLTLLRKKLMRVHIPRGRIQFKEEVTVRIYRTTTWEKQAW